MGCWCLGSCEGILVLNSKRWAELKKGEKALAERRALFSRAGCQCWDMIFAKAGVRTVGNVPGADIVSF